MTITKDLEQSINQSKPEAVTRRGRKTCMNKSRLVLVLPLTVVDKMAQVFLSQWKIKLNANYLQHSSENRSKINSLDT